RPSKNSLPVKVCRAFLLAVSVSDLYYDTGIISHCQHLFYNFLKKSRKNHHPGKIGHDGDLTSMIVLILP
ncbi:MAG: hypothetical protein IIZ16_10130, partial [Selenomonas sp.]|nr:hypothetical protein [Selenomonas sp.]